MTPEDVRNEVENIRKIARDDEAAHCWEDALHQKVLRAVAEGQCSQPQECAAIALTTLDIDFARYCA